MTTPSTADTQLRQQLGLDSEFGFWNPSKHPRNKGKFAPVGEGEVNDVAKAMRDHAGKELARTGHKRDASGYDVERNKNGSHTVTVGHEGDDSSSLVEHKVTIGHDEGGNKVAHIHQNNTESSGVLRPDPAHAVHRAALKRALADKGFRMTGSPGQIVAATNPPDVVGEDPLGVMDANAPVLDGTAVPESNDPDEDPGELAEAIDAVIDAIKDELAELPVELLPPQVQQAAALLTAAEVTVDQLLEILQLPDLDDPDDAEAAAMVATTRDLAAFRLQCSAYGVLDDNSAPVAPALEPKTDTPEVNQDPEKLAGQITVQLDQLASGGTDEGLDNARGIAAQVSDALNNGDNDGAADYADGLVAALGDLDSSGYQPEQAQTLDDVVSLATQLAAALQPHDQTPDQGAPPIGDGAGKPFDVEAARAVFDHEQIIGHLSPEMFADLHPGDRGEGQGNGNKGNAESLKKWFREGADGQIPWGVPGDFDACTRLAAKHMSLNQAHGFCNLRHHEVTGEYAGKDAHGGGGKHAADDATFAGRGNETAAGRRKAAKSGVAMKDGSFPIGSVDQLDSAIRLAGNAKDPTAAKRHIKRRAKALGATGKIPDSWQGSGDWESFAPTVQQSQATQARKQATAARKQATARRVAARKQAVAARKQAAQKKKQQKQQQKQQGGSGGAAGGFNPAQHPRGAAGSATGGEFIAVGSGGGQNAQGSDQMDQVKGVQDLLGLGVSGTLSAGDASDIKHFQESNGLQADGVVGTQTTAALKALQAGKAPGTASGVQPGALSAGDQNFLKSAGQKTGLSNRSGAQFDLDNPQGDEVGEVQIDGREFRLPVGIIEGVPTGDRRKIKAEALTWREPPLPVMALLKTTQQHQDAELVGHVTELERVDASEMTNPKTGEPYGEGVYVISGKGKFANRELADEVAGLVREKFLRGVSADLSDVTQEFEAGEGDDAGEVDLISMLSGKGNGTELVTAGRIMGFTVLPFPAFEGAYLEMDDGVATPAVAEPVEDGGEQIEPEAVAASANWGAFRVVDEFAARRCAPCESGALTASAQPAPIYPPKAWFERPEFTGVTAHTITDEGRVFGHLAPWNQCHTGISGQCVIAPRSRTGYSMFMNKALKTAEGEVIPVGILTMGIGHAPEELGVGATLAHYDNAKSQVAQVVVGEDQHGIWYSGALMPDLDEISLRRFRATGLSGDWRLHGGGLELMAALAVNVEGFPKARALVAGGAIRTLIAAGGREVIRHALAQEDHEPQPEPDASSTWVDRWVHKMVEDKVATLRSRVVPQRLDVLRASMYGDLDGRVAALREQVVRPFDERRVAALRASMDGLTTGQALLDTVEMAFWDPKKHPRDRGKFAPSEGDAVKVHSPGHMRHGVVGTVQKVEGEHAIVRPRRRSDGRDDFRVRTNRLQPASLTAAGYDESHHPRGKNGKWIHIGDAVDIGDGKTGLVTGINGDHLKVKRLGRTTLVKADTVNGTHDTQGRVGVVGDRIPTSGVRTPNDTTPEQRNNGGRNLTDEELARQQAPKAAAPKPITASKVHAEMKKLGHKRQTKTPTLRTHDGQLLQSTPGAGYTVSRNWPSGHTVNIKPPAGGLRPDQRAIDKHKADVNAAMEHFRGLGYDAKQGNPNNPSQFDVTDRAPAQPAGEPGVSDVARPAGEPGVSDVPRPAGEPGVSDRLSPAEQTQRANDVLNRGGSQRDQSNAVLGKPSVDAANAQAVGEVTDMVNNGEIDRPAGYGDLVDQVDPGWLNSIAEEHGVDPGVLAIELDKALAAQHNTATP